MGHLQEVGRNIWYLFLAPRVHVNTVLTYTILKNQETRCTWKF